MCFEILYHQVYPWVVLNPADNVILKPLFYQFVLIITIWFRKSYFFSKLSHRHFVLYFNFVLVGQSCGWNEVLYIYIFFFSATFLSTMKNEAIYIIESGRNIFCIHGMLNEMVHNMYEIHLYKLINNIFENISSYSMGLIGWK